MTNKVHIKKETSKAKVDRQLEVFASLPADRKPANIKRLDDVTYQYDWLEDSGVACDPLSVAALAAKHLWKERVPPGQRGIEARLAYAGYIGARSSDRHLQLFLKHTQSLRWCVQVHGDLTLENVIDYRFIDPGEPRGMVCIENDLGKLMQSVSGWESIKRGWSVQAYDDFRLVHCSPAVYAFEMSHWIRLSKHPELHNANVINHAHHRIERLVKYLEAL